MPADLALRVGVAAGEALERDVGHAVRDLGAVARGVDVRARTSRIRSSTMIPPVMPVLTPAAAASAVFGSLWVATTTRSAGISPPEVATARSLPPVAEERRHLGVEVQV